MTIAAAASLPVLDTPITEMCSYAIDAWFGDPSVLTDQTALITAMHDAAVAGGATVLGKTSAILPDGAVIAVLLLSQSHLSVHTWPGQGLAAFDLLTCGRLHGEKIVGHLRGALRPDRIAVGRTIRDVR